MNYRDFLQKVIYVIINPIIKAMIRLHITPNIVTFIGFIGNIVAAGSSLRQLSHRVWNSWDGEDSSSLLQDSST